MSKEDDKGLGTHVNELISMVIAYAKQETVVPLKNLGRYIGFGVAGAMLLAAGGALATLTVVRVIQTETVPHLTGNLTWVPYLGGILLAAVGALWAATRIGKDVRR